MDKRGGRIVCVALAALLPALPTVAIAQTLSPEGDGAGGMRASGLDYTHPENRDRPIRCKDGDIEYFAGKSMADVFGDAWPAAPRASRSEPARTGRTGVPRWPKGLGQSGATVVTATLVGTDGRALESRAICATAPAIAAPVVRAALASRYIPATFDGVAGVSVAVRVWRFNIVDRPDAPQARPR